jgi:hypothetical protein
MLTETEKELLVIMGDMVHSLEGLTGIDMCSVVAEIIRVEMGRDTKTLTMMWQDYKERIDHAAIP